MRNAALLWSSLLLASPLTAQKMPAAGDPDRVVATYPIAEALDRSMEHSGDTVRGESARPDAVRDQCRRELLAAIRRFVQPPLGDGEHVVELGPDRLVALVRPTQAAWIDQFFAHLAKTDLAARLDGRFDRVTLPAARAAEILGRADLGERVAMTLTREQVQTLRREKDKVGGPTSWRFPHATWMTFGSGMPFVKTWRRVPLRARDDDLTAPVLGQARDGVEFELQYVPLPDGRIGWILTAELAIVDWKTPPATVRVGDRDYVTDEPAVRSAKLDATLTMEQPMPFAFGHRLGEDYMVLVFTPK